jgi:anti-sigma-K factor RskA
MLTEQEISLIVERTARRVVELQTAQPAKTGDVLTRSEARAYTKRNSEAAFCDWCARWGVKPAFRGRYSKTRLDLALNRESRARAA